jgi:hypothetical protein
MKLIAIVMAQSEPINVASKKSETGQVTKSYIRLKELGGDYEDEYQCAVFGNLALVKFQPGEMVAASLRFQLHESGGQYYQDIVANEIRKLSAI